MNLHPLIVTAWTSPRDTVSGIGCPDCLAWSEVIPTSFGCQFACPACGRLLLLNMFAIRADWRPIARAWRPDGEQVASWTEGAEGAKREDLIDMHRLLRADAHVLQQRPHLFFSQAANAPDSQAPARMARRRLEDGLEDRTWFRWLNKHKAQAQACMATLTGHKETVTTCAIFPDGRRIVSGSQDRTLKLWDIESGVELMTLQGHGAFVTACAVSPDGRGIVSTDYSGVLKLWDADSGSELITLRAGNPPYSGGCTFSPDGRRIVSESSEALTVWDVETGEALLTLPGPRRVNACAFSPDGRFIATAGGMDVRSSSPDYHDTLRLWDATTGSVVAAISRSREPHRLPVSACAFSPDSNYLVGAGGDVRLWQIVDGEPPLQLCERAKDGFSAQITACAFAPHGRWFVTASLAHTATIWETTSLARLVTFHGHTAGVNACAVSPDARWIITASDDKTLKVWDTETRTNSDDNETLRPGRLHAASLDGGWVASIKRGSTHPPRFQAAAGGQLLAPRFGRASVTAAESCDGFALALPELETVRVFNVESGAALMLLPEPAPEPVSRVLPSYAVDGSRHVRCVAFAPDGKRIATASHDRKVRIWDAANGALVAVLEGHQLVVNACAFSPDGRRLVSGSDDHTLKVWDLEVASDVLTLTGHQEPVWGCAFFPNHCCILSASDDGTLKLWDGNVGELLGEYFAEGLERFACGPNRLLALSTGAQDLRLLELERPVHSVAAGDELPIRIRPEIPSRIVFVPDD